MNRIIYLFELDSVLKHQHPTNTGVLNTPGVKALFSEIIKNGNSVALTMNQLTDSQFIREALDDDTAYSSLLKLFENGALKVSLYGKIRTASQYIQQAIQKCLDEDKDTFVFSNLPVKNNETILLSEIKDALQFSDLAILNERINNTSSEEKNRYKTIYRFVNMILQLSICETSNIPPKQEARRTFEEFLNIILDELSSMDFGDPSFNNQINSATKIIKQRGKDIVSGRENRSNWLNTFTKDQTEILANEIIHICYNYTVEDSINGVSKHYDDNNFESTFKIDLANRIELYCKKENSQEVFYAVHSYQWNTVTRFAEYGLKANCADNTSNATTYEKNFNQEKKKWIFYIFKKNLVALVFAVVYIAIFCIVNLGTSWLEDMVPFAFSNLFLASLSSVIIFGILGSVIDTALKFVNHGENLPDILENLIDILIHFCDFWRVIGGSHDSYRLY